LNASFDPDLTEKEVGPETAAIIHRAMFDTANSKYLDFENVLRDLNSFVAPRGSTEALIAERRAFLEMETEEERQMYNDALQKKLEEARTHSYGVGDDDLPERPYDEFFQDEEEKERALLTGCDIQPHHDWSETVIRVDRVQKVTKGGTILRYRCLVVGWEYQGIRWFWDR
jgi:hypothetical protein